MIPRVYDTDDEFHTRTAEVAKLMKRHEKLLDLLRDGSPVAGHKITTSETTTGEGQ